MPKWISMFYRTKGLNIAPDAAALLAEHAGTDLNKIAIETEKMLKNLPEGVSEVSVADIEKNVGISRQFSIFELTKELSYKNSAKALRIAAYLGSSAKFAMPMAVSALFTHFNRILKYSALLMKTKNPMNDQKAKVLGVNPYFFAEYDVAVRNYPLNRCMAVISLLKEYDYKGKGGETGEATPAELMVELTAKILNI
jgi:DNA polymerase-3 subunit delta